MDGIEVAKALKQQDKFVNIVFLTAFNSFEYAHEALKIGAIDYLLKPYDPKEIDFLIDKKNEKVYTLLLVWRKTLTKTC